MRNKWVLSFKNKAMQSFNQHKYTCLSLAEPHHTISRKLCFGFWVKKQWGDVTDVLIDPFPNFICKLYSEVNDDWETVDSYSNFDEDNVDLDVIIDLEANNTKKGKAMKRKTPTNRIKVKEVNQATRNSLNNNKAIAKAELEIDSQLVVKVNR